VIDVVEQQSEFPSTSFLAGCPGTHTAFFFAKEIDHRTTQGLQNTTFVAINAQGWTQYSLDVGWSCIAMATVKPIDGVRTVVGIGARGHWWEAQPATADQKTGQIKDLQYHLRCLRTIGNRFYTAGMDRMVQRRLGPGQWEPIGPQRPEKSEGIVGFEDIDGFSEDEIYAVGWQGEIWRCLAGRWSRIDSPVSANLHAVCCASDGMVYAVGASGCMLKGRGETWEIIDTGRDADLMDVSEHDSQIYAVTNFSIHKLDGGILVAETDFADGDRPRECLFLERGPGVLLSIASKDVFKQTGSGWTRIVW
jgi:hypothetical protein